MTALKNEGPREELLTVAEVAAILNVHPNTVRRWESQGLLRAWRLGPRGDRRFRNDDIQNFLRSDGTRAHKKKSLALAIKSR